jgi:primosomal protein N' (replication factor Y)
MSTLFPGSTSVGFARIAVERGVDRYPEGLTYAIPPELASLQPGDRVQVPLGKGNRPTAGYVIDISAQSEFDPDNIKQILRSDPAGIKLPGQLMTLAKWISSYYVCPIGMTLATMMPAAVKKHIGSVRRMLVEINVEAASDESERKMRVEDSVAPRLSPKQKRVIEILRDLAKPIDLRELAALAELRTTGPIKKLIEAGLLRAIHRTGVEAAWSAQAIESNTPPDLTLAQRRILEPLAAALTRGFSTHLIFGVTGSGKTEVYFRLIEQTLAQGKVALVLVPEISLTPQTGGRLIGRFPAARVAVLHSGLTQAQRHQQWTLAAEGKADIVLGARSAVFAPLPDDQLGLIVIDEEHDGSYKQDQMPRYQGRDVAIRRAQLTNCPVVLGSATPSLESWHNATVRRAFTLHRLDERIPGMNTPSVTVVDFHEQMKQHHDRKVHLIGPMLEGALRDTLDAGGQALILLNRRGYANYIACPDHHCGWMLHCDDCDATMVYHKDRSLGTGGYVRCHHCAAEQRLPDRCPVCQKKVSVFGLGTQRVEEELGGTFPELVEGKSMLRLDSDAMHKSTDYHKALSRFATGEIKLMLGTQMIAKGLDYPNVRLVGVINADTAINLPDFRAAERTFQLVNQVAGRSGRGIHPGRVIVQSFEPSIPAIQLAAANRYEEFARMELASRERFGLPPSTRMARLVVRDEDSIECQQRARMLAEQLRTVADKQLRIRGPAPCPISRIAGKYRHQIEMLAPTATLLQQFLTRARNAQLISAGAELVVDVDPVALL